MSVPGHIVCFFIVSSCFYCAKFDSEAGYLGFFLGGSSAGGSSALATPAIDSFSFLAADNASLTTDVTGTINGTTLTADRQGNANSAYLYGASGEITLAAGPAVSSTGSWTFALWVRPDVFGADTANSGAGNGDFILDRTPENNPLVNFKISNLASHVD